MKPQKQKFRHNEGNGEFGDCHRTCIAMVLDLDRDDVPHFMDGIPAGLAPDHPDSQAAEKAERDWLAMRGLTPVYVPYLGDMPLQQLLDQLKWCASNSAVILGCTSGNGFNHSVVVYKGEIYNPNNSGIDGPMNDGMWWVTIYAHLTQPLQDAAADASVVTQENS